MTGWSGAGQVIRGDGTRTGPDTWQQALDADEDINAFDHDTHDQVLAEAIEQCLNLNGENSPTAPINFGNQRITNLGVATALSHAPQARQVVRGGLNWGGTTSGTANAQTCNLTLGLDTYAAGLRIQLIWGFTNTGSGVTLNVNGTGAKPVRTRDGGVLGAGDIRAGRYDELVDDGTNFRLIREVQRSICALVSRSTPQVIASETPTAIQWAAISTLHSDLLPLTTANFWSSTVNPSRLFAPPGAQRVRLRGQVVIQTQGDTEYQASIWRNGSEAFPLPKVAHRVGTAEPGHPVIMNVESPVIAIASGTYFELVVYHNHSSSREAAGTADLTWFALEVVRGLY